jgi:hypothetical protein
MVFTVGSRRGGQFTLVRPHMRAYVMAMFFVKGRRYAPGQAFSEVIILGDGEGNEHRLKIGVRGRCRLFASPTGPEAYVPCQ